jgi:hypothetical protein
MIMVAMSTLLGIEDVRVPLVVFDRCGFAKAGGHWSRTTCGT